MERTVLTFSIANIITVNLMVLAMACIFAFATRAMRGRADG